MHLIEMKRGGFSARFEVPATWNELTGSQLQYISKLLMNGKLPAAITRQRMLLHFMDVKWWKLKTQWMLFWLDDETLYDLMKLTDWVFGECTLTKNLLPSVKLNIGKVLFNTFYGPADGLANITVEEWAFADSFYMKYRQTKDNKYLDMLTACLYRPAKVNYDPAAPDNDGDIRQPFNRHSLDFYVDLMGKVPMEVKYAVFLFFDGCRNKLVKQYEKVFTRDKQAAGQNFGWAGVIMDLSGGIFGSLEATEKQKLGTVMIHLVRSMEKKEDWEKKNKK